MRNLNACIGANNCSTANSSSNAKNSSTADAPSATKNSSSQPFDGFQPTMDNSHSQDFQDSNPESFISTSDCSSLSSPYVPSLTRMAPTSSNVSFNIKCDTDYSDPDAGFLTVAVFAFENCIAACASFNEVRFFLHPPNHYRAAGITRQISRVRCALFYSKNRGSKTQNYLTFLIRKY